MKFVKKNPGKDGSVTSGWRTGLRYLPNDPARPTTRKKLTAIGQASGWQ